MKKIKMCILILTLIFISSCGNQSINNKNWYYSSINVEQLWKYSKGKSQTIAIIDTGISNYAKKLYKDRIIGTYNSLEKNSNVTDENGHGTEMTSIVIGNGKHGVWGIAPKANVIIIKAIGANGTVKPESIANAIEYAVSKKVSVINMSFGSFISNKKIKYQINNAIKNHISVVAAAGDYGNKDLLFPASMKGVISIEAKNKKNKIWNSSNISPTAVAAFPGEKIKTISWRIGSNKKYIISYSSGTSEATAIASGYIALLRDHYVKKHIEFTNSMIVKKMQLIKSTSVENPDYLISFRK